MLPKCDVTNLPHTTLLAYYRCYITKYKLMTYVIWHDKYLNSTWNLSISHWSVFVYFHVWRCTFLVRFFSRANTTKSAKWYFLLFLAQINRKYLPKRIRWLKVWSEDEPFKTPYKISCFVRSLTLYLLHNDRHHIVNSLQKDTANEQFTCEIVCSVSGQKGQVGESIFFIL